MGSKFFGVKIYLWENIAISSSWAGLGPSLAIKISKKSKKSKKNVQKEISRSEEKGDFKCGPAQPNLFFYFDGFPEIWLTEQKIGSPDLRADYP